MKKPVKYLLVAGLVAAGLATGVCVYLSVGRKSEAQSAPQAERMPVVFAQVREMVFEERVKVSGNVEAKHTALVSARVPGALDNVFVDEGDPVKAGETKLFQTDKVKLGRAVESAEQQVVVATARVSAQQAAVERFEADLIKAKIDYERYQRLCEQGAVTKIVFEAQELNYKQAQAALKAEKANLELARAQEQQAKSSLAIAQKDLDDSLVVAPIDGVICQRLLEPGEMAGAGTPVLRIDNLTVVEFTAYLPEAYYARVVEGETVVRAKSGGIDIGEVVVTTKSPTISPRLRTFEIKALLKNPPAGVVPGGIVELVVVLEKRNALGVPRESLVRRENGLALFTAKDGAARMMPVEAGLEMDGWVEVRADGLAKDTPIVRMGQDRLNDGTLVTEVKEGTN